eukprot:COSAG02_NODE_1356_length_13093_cov_351.171695_3_plen_182_part_00
MATKAVIASGQAAGFDPGPPASSRMIRLPFSQAPPWIKQRRLDFAIHIPLVMFFKSNIHNRPKDARSDGTVRRDEGDPGSPGKLRAAPRSRQKRTKNGHSSRDDAMSMGLSALNRKKGTVRGSVLELPPRAVAALRASAPVLRSKTGLQGRSYASLRALTATAPVGYGSSALMGSRRSIPT